MTQTGSFRSLGVMYSHVTGYLHYCRCKHSGFLAAAILRCNKDEHNDCYYRTRGSRVVLGLFLITNQVIYISTASA